MPCFLNNDNVQSTIEMFLYDGSGVGVTGLTLGSFAAGEFQIGKSNAGAFANAAGTLTERAGGTYTYKPSNSEADTLGEIVLKVVKATINGGKPIIIVDEVKLPERRGAVAAGTLTTSAFTTDLTFTDVDHVKDALVEFYTGNNKGVVKPIGGYTVSGGLVTLKTGFTLPNAPVAGDKFRIVSR